MTGNFTMIVLANRKQEQNSPNRVSANGRLERNLVKEVQEKEKKGRSFR
jgi:hypothetical protein